MALCVRCGERWAQSSAGLCRHCERVLGDTRTTWERDLARMTAHKAALVEAPPLAPSPPFRVLNVDRQTFDVIWDGTGGESIFAAIRRYRRERA